jgi:hypothetical protein
MTFGQELVVLNTTLSTFGGVWCKLGVDVEFERRTYQEVLK